MVSIRVEWIRRLLVLGAILCAALVWNEVLAPRPAGATPSYARRYDTACETCHAPNPARLNNVGMVFRRSGFRLPDSDDDGKLILKAIPAHGIGDALSVAGQLDANVVQDPAPGTNKASFQLSEVEIIAGTAIGDHYSTQMLLIPYNDDGDFELEGAEFQANYGQPGSQFIMRGGKMQTLFWQKGGHGSMTASFPLILDEGSPAPIGDFAGPGFGQMLSGFEVGYMKTRLNKGKMLAGLVSLSALNGFEPDGSVARTHPGTGLDVLAQATALIGSRNTANVFYYNGRTVVDPEGVLPTPGPFKDEFRRIGATGNIAPIERVDLTAGVSTGQDKSQQLGATIKTSGYYGEVTGQLLPHWVATYRHDRVDPNTDSAATGDAITDNVFGTTYVLHDTVFLSAEWQEFKVGDVKSHGILGRIRLIY